MQLSTTFSPQQNPVLEAEFKHQRFVIKNSRSGLFWIGLAMLMVVPALIASLVYIVAATFNLFPEMPFFDFPTSYHAYVAVLLVLVNLSLYPVVHLVTIGLSANSIRREKTGHTWGLLRLSDVSPEQIAFGKWWASLRALNGDHAMVILVRVGLVALYMQVLFPAYLALDDLTAPHTVYFLLLVPFVIGQGLLDAALSAALGIMGTVPDDAAGAVTTSSVFVIRLFLAIATGIWLVWVLLRLQSSATAAFSIAAGGIIVWVILLLVALYAGYKLVEQA